MGRKGGSRPSVNRGAINPAMVPWDIYFNDGTLAMGTLAMANFYNSSTYFLAVRLY